jgi:hypothetical protein
MLRNLNCCDSEWSELPLDASDQNAFGELTAFGYVPEAWMQPMINIALEGHDAASQAEDNQKEGRSQANAEMKVEQGFTHGYKCKS